MRTVLKAEKLLVEMSNFVEKIEKGNILNFAGLLAWLCKKVKGTINKNRVFV